MKSSVGRFRDEALLSQPSLAWDEARWYPPFEVSVDPADRRRYPRMRADVLWRPAGLGVFHGQRNLSNLSLAGMRAFSDIPLQVGQRLECEVLPTEDRPIRVWGSVVWCVPTEDGSNAAYEAGVMFTDMEAADIQRLAGLMVRD